MIQLQDYGLPTRMARAIDAACKRAGRPLDDRKAGVLDSILTDDDRIPVQAAESAIQCAGDQAAREVYALIERCGTTDAILIGIGMICRRYGIPVPAGRDDRGTIARAVDPQFWKRALRKEHARRFEHVAIQLGLVGRRADPYISRESALRQRARNLQNKKTLEGVTLQNECGQEYTLAELAELGTSNKEIRRGELMTRIRGFEEIARDLGHVGLFGTITCPSRFHAVEGQNPNYAGASPRDGQAHLAKVWSRMRPALERAGILIYGFRIAEPHSDGCPHWHTLLFMNTLLEGATVRRALPRAKAIIRRYALGHAERRGPAKAELVAGYRARGLTFRAAGVLAAAALSAWRIQERKRQNEAEAGAKQNRVKLVEIDPAKGSASAYVAKYISKNIDGHGVTDHKDQGGNSVYTDYFDGFELTASERVTYWAQRHGIRQFQQIGGAPVQVWRELRRIQEETVRHAPECVQAAYHAVQAIKADRIQADGETKTETIKQADWKAYLYAQGGPRVGRKGAVQLARIETRIEGRYEVYQDMRPVGVQARDQGGVYQSVRYHWTVKDGGRPQSVAVFDLPWTGVNNCTDKTKPAPAPGKKSHVMRQPSSNAPWIRPEPAPAALQGRRIAGVNLRAALQEGRAAPEFDGAAVQVRPDPKKHALFLAVQEARAEARGEKIHLNRLRAKLEG